MSNMTGYIEVIISCSVKDCFTHKVTHTPTHTPTRTHTHLHTNTYMLLFYELIKSLRSPTAITTRDKKAHIKRLTISHTHMCMHCMCTLNVATVAALISL